MQSFRSAFVTLRERRYHQRIWGDDDAPTLFFLHGWGDLSASFQFVVDALPGRWRIIAPDWRGFGLSQWNEGAYWFPDYLADLDALLEHYSPEQPARIVGHSMGGIIASLYAGIRPERVARLANLEGFVLWVSPANDNPARCEKWLQQLRQPAAGFRPYRQRAEFATRLLRDNPRLTPERAHFIAENSLLAAPDADGYVFAADPRHRWINPVLYPLAEAQACWRRMRAPTLLIAGSNSPTMKKFIDQPHAFAEREACFAEAQRIWIDDCGHNHHHDQPEELARQLEAFFSAPSA